MPLGGKTGLVNEAVNQVTNEKLTSAIQYMASDEYKKTRSTDPNDVIPTHRKHVAKNDRAEDAHFEVHKLERKGHDGGDGSDEGSDDELEALRAERMGKVKKQLERQAEWTAKGHGVYSEIAQDDFFKTVVREKGGSEMVVVHFYHRDFQRCLIIDKHLENLAPQMMPIRFVKISVEKAPFLVEKLRINVLPCCVLFVNDVATDRIVGFEEVQTNEKGDDIEEDSFKFRIEVGLGLAEAE